MIDKYAPIIPYVGIGGLRLDLTKKEAEEMIGSPLKDGEDFFDGRWSRYTVEDLLHLFFDNRTDRLFKITTLPGYRGKLFEKIGTDTDEADLLRLEPTLEYDDFEEVYVSKEKGVFIETDLPAEKAAWISVFVRDIEAVCMM